MSARRSNHSHHGRWDVSGDPTISNTVTTAVTLGVAPYFSPLTIAATGTIAPTAKGAYPAVLAPSSLPNAILINQGRIVGPAGLVAGSSLPGGDGVDFAASGTLTNSGTIVGGNGGSNTHFFSGGRGGAGASLTSTGTIINTGTIIGGTGGPGGALPTGGFGGAGVSIDSGTLINSGTIIEGAAGGLADNRVGPAVQFGSGAATLVVEPSAVFTGQIVANTAATDVLVLSGTAPATLTGLGTNFVNFSRIAMDQGAHWTWNGANTLSAGTTLAIGSGSTLTNSGSVYIAGNLSVSGAGSFVNNGSLAMTGTGEADIGSAFINAAAVSVGSGKMAFLSSVGGTGTVAIQSGAAAAFLNGAAATQHASFQGSLGELDLGKPSTFLGAISNFASLDRIDLLTTPATSLSYAANKLTVKNGNATVASLAFTGNYKQTNFVLGSDGHGGSLITWHS